MHACEMHAFSKIEYPVLNAAAFPAYTMLPLSAVEFSEND